jgi:hypothetical protein
MKVNAGEKSLFVTQDSFLVVFLHAAEDFPGEIRERTVIEHLDKVIAMTATVFLQFGRLPKSASYEKSDFNAGKTGRSRNRRQIARLYP